jgi:hypothetical protein
MMHIEKDKLVIPLDTVLASMSDENKAMLMKCAAIEEEVIEAIVGYICRDMTQDGWWTSGEWVDRLRLRISEHLGGAETEALRRWMNRSTYFYDEYNRMGTQVRRMREAFEHALRHYYEKTGEICPIQIPVDESKSSDVCVLYEEDVKAVLAATKR